MAVKVAVLAGRQWVDEGESVKSSGVHCYRLCGAGSSFMEEVSCCLEPRPSFLSLGATTTRRARRGHDWTCQAPNPCFDDLRQTCGC